MTAKDFENIDFVYRPCSSRLIGSLVTINTRKILLTYFCSVGVRVQFLRKTSSGITATSYPGRFWEEVGITGAVLAKFPTKTNKT